MPDHQVLHGATPRPYPDLMKSRKALRRAPLSPPLPKKILIYTDNTITLVKEMDLSDAILCILRNIETGVGRTTLQKLLYFASRKGIVRASFRPYYYGPYAEDVFITIQNLVSLGFLEERLESYASGYSGYQYLITRDGRQIVSAHVPDSGGLDRIIEIARRHFGFSQKMLSAAAKVYFILEYYNMPKTIEAITREASNLGWEVTTDEVKNVVAFLEDLDLVKVK